MGIIRSRGTMEENEESGSQESCYEDDKPLLKKRCLSFIDTIEAEKDELESESESESDSDEEEESSSVGDRDNYNMQPPVLVNEECNNQKQPMLVNKKCNNNKQLRLINEEEEDASSESESENGTERSNEEEALELGRKEEQGKTIGVIHSKAAIEENEESESEESSFEVKLLSVKTLHLPSSDIPKGDIKENDEDDGEFETDSGEEEESSSSENTNNNHKQTMVVNEEHTSNNHKQTLVVNEGEENDSSESESKGDSEGSNGQDDLHMGGEEEQGKVAQSESLMGMSQKKTNSVVSPKSYPVDAMEAGTVSKSIADKKPLKANWGRNLYHRWSDDDVITLLEGMIKVKDKMSAGKNYLSGLCDLIRVSSHFKPDAHQASEKIRRLKLLYKKNVRKPYKNFTSHQKRVFELSKILWGIELGAKLSEENYNAKRSQYSQFNKILMGDYCSQARKTLKKGFDIIEKSQRKSALEERWIKLRLREIQLYQEKLATVKGYLDGVMDELHASLRSLQEARVD